MNRCVVILLFLKTFTLSAQEWIPVKGPKPFGISGIVLVEQGVDYNRFLVVHDNKGSDEGRLAVITDFGLFNEYRPLVWPDSNNMPKDLEAATAIPGAPGQFFVMSSLGKTWHISLDSNNNVSILRYFQLPNVTEADNFEGVSVQRINTNLLFLWGHRGDSEDPGVIYWSIFDPKTYQFTSMGKEKFAIQWPIRKSVRHISDMKLDSTGILYVTAASDAGDDGPFTSAVYIAGVFSSWGTEVHFRKNHQLTRLFTFYNRKVEAIEFVQGPHGGIILGSDDENQGGAICKTWP